MTKNTQNKGFTLVEILIAISVFAIVGVMAANGLQSTIQNKTIIEQRAGQQERVSNALRIIMFDLIQLSTRGISDGTVSQAAFELTSPGPNKDFLKFTTFNTHLVGLKSETDLARVVYRIDDNNLYRVQYRVLSENYDVEKQKSLILKDVKTVKIKVLHKKSWEIAWPPLGVGTDKINLEALLPNAVEFIIVQKNGIEHRLLIPGVNNLVESADEEKEEK